MATQTKHPTATIKLVAQTYDPAGLVENPLNAYFLEDVRLVEYKAPRGLPVQGYPGQTLAQVREWMEANDLVVAGTKLARSQQMRGWKGVYVLKLGKREDFVSVYDVVQAVEPTPVHIPEFEF